MSRFFKIIGKYFLFIIQIIGWFAIICFLTIITSGISLTIFGKNLKLSNNDFILLITAAFILAYTYETKKLKEETIFQRKMSDANDIDFQIYQYRIDPEFHGNTIGSITMIKRLNNISEFTFLTPIIFKPIGELQGFSGLEDDNLSIRADYVIKTEKEIKEFLKTIEIQNGKIKARVKTTNGVKFIYTFRILGDSWKKALKGTYEYKGDQFIIIKKELDE